MHEAYMEDDCVPIVVFVDQIKGHKTCREDEQESTTQEASFLPPRSIDHACPKILPVFLSIHNLDSTWVQTTLNKNNDNTSNVSSTAAAVSGHLACVPKFWPSNGSPGATTPQGTIPWPWPPFL
jgi:hypothetical protein